MVLLRILISILLLLRISDLARNSAPAPDPSSDTARNPAPDPTSAPDPASHS